MLVIAGQILLATGVGAVLLPALIGNILGGTVLFSLIAYAQVQEEM
jgi:formate/nitrite transporter FocA (FNT family)